MARFIGLLFLWPMLLYPAKTLDIYFVDVEGGQATLVVAPSGQSMMVDAGWPGFNGRDADRIVAAAKKAGVKQIDVLVVTHYHRDHVGGVAQLVERIPVKTLVVDHGPQTETSRDAKELYAEYEAIAQKVKRLTVKPGDSIPLKGVSIDVVAANGDVIARPRAGAGAENPLCASIEKKADDPTENARSVGFVLTWNKFRWLNLGDLTWNKELELACPANKIGTVDLYLTTHHGLSQSGPPALVHALRPKVAVMNNGAKKGGSPEAWQIIHRSPGLEDIWQLHYALAGGKDNNTPDAMIANPEENCSANYIKVTVRESGEFTVLNTRNKYEKTYK
jgi:competence protein ComEC